MRYIEALRHNFIWFILNQFVVVERVTVDSKWFPNKKRQGKKKREGHSKHVIDLTQTF